MLQDQLKAISFRRYEKGAVAINVLSASTLTVLRNCASKLSRFFCLSQQMGRFAVLHLARHLVRAQRSWIFAILSAGGCAWEVGLPSRSA